MSVYLVTGMHRKGKIFSRKPVSDITFFFDFICSQGSAEAEFSQLHENIIRKHASKTGTTSTTNIGISLSLRMLHGHFDQLKREMPLLFAKGVTTTRKLGFSDFIMPGGKSRHRVSIQFNSIYLLVIPA